ncbi:MAG TPA: hypothetical protein VFP65_09340 [Anaeromyxobacteraceae bacterium]|nr:hypothetical protein [Anaeromyxobacteraceae bacterium]
MRDRRDRVVALALLGAALALGAAPRAARALDAADPAHAAAPPPAGLTDDLRLEVAPRLGSRRSAAVAALATGGVLLASGLALALVSRPSALDASSRTPSSGTGAVWRAEDRRFLLRFDPAASSLCIAGGLAASLGAWLFITAPELSTDFEPIRNGFLVHYRGNF